MKHKTVSVTMLVTGVLSHLAAMKQSLDTEESCIINEIPDDSNVSNTFKTRTVNQDPL